MKKINLHQLSQRQVVRAEVPPAEVLRFPKENLFHGCELP